MPELMKGLGVGMPGQAMMTWQQFRRWGMYNIKYGTPGRRALTIAKPLGAAGLAVAGCTAATALLRKLTAGPSADGVARGAPRRRLRPR